MGNLGYGCLGSMAKVIERNETVATTTVKVQAETLGVGVSGALNARASAAVLASAVVDDLFRSYRLLSDGEVAALRQAGANNQEMILSTVIATKTRKPARQFYHEVKTGATTWGTLLQQAKIDPRNMQQEIATILEVQAIK